ncbi:Golgi SNAP receptor complex member 1-1-like [Silene latifolia]|uniref:Golgi SNAP receptor complex member 1-1-like n=1 Tax=Silene latifolia TaxID=37657 RepID=UPI003D7857B8
MLSANLHSFRAGHSLINVTSFDYRSNVECRRAVKYFATKTPCFLHTNHSTPLSPDQANWREKREPSIQLKVLESSAAMDVPTSWDALRKQARNLEAQLDEQMVFYRKLVSAKADTEDNNIQSGIEQLLKQLDQVNNQMRAWVSSGGSEMVSHTLTRHQEILQDLTQEFYRLRSSLKAKQEHASLLQDFREFDLNKLDLEEGGNLEDQVLLKEYATISRNTGQLDSVISQAQSTLGTLVFQRSTFGGINSKISNVSSRLPTVNQILASIKKKKSMDTIIISLVASVCTFLIFIYWLSK